MLKDKPEEWHTLRQGILLIPLTKDACDRYDDQSFTTSWFAYCTASFRRCLDFFACFWRGRWCRGFRITGRWFRFRSL